MGLNPAVDGHALRVPIPKASAESRAAAVKAAAAAGEESKKRARRVRTHVLDKLKKAKHVSEDDVRRYTKVFEGDMKSAVDAMSDLVDSKRAELQ